MIGAVTGPGTYTSRVQWNPYQNQNVRGKAEDPALIAQKAASPETPVQPVDAAAPVSDRASGNVNTDLSVRNSADVTAMAVRSRISPAQEEEQAQAVGTQEEEQAQAVSLPGAQEEEQAQAASLPGAQEEQAQAVGGEQEEMQLLPGVNGGEQAQAMPLPGAQEEQAQEAPQAIGREPENDPAAQQAEREARAEERARTEQEAQEQREAYLESVEQTQSKRSERVEALRAEQSQDAGEEEAAVNGIGTGQEEEEQEPGSLELDYAAALMRNYQMTNLLRGQIAARTEGGDPEPFNAALEALSQNGQERLRFVTENDRENSRVQAQQAYQRMMQNSVLPGVVA